MGIFNKASGLLERAAPVLESDAMKAMKAEQELQRLTKAAEESRIWQAAEQSPELAEANALHGGTFENKFIGNDFQVVNDKPVDYFEGKPSAEDGRGAAHDMYRRGELEANMQQSNVNISEPSAHEHTLSSDFGPDAASEARSLEKTKISDVQPSEAVQESFDLSKNVKPEVDLPKDSLFDQPAFHKDFGPGVEYLGKKYGPDEIVPIKEIIKSDDWSLIKKAKDWSLQNKGKAITGTVLAGLGVGAAITTPSSKTSTEKRTDSVGSKIPSEPISEIDTKIQAAQAKVDSDKANREIEENKANIQDASKREEFYKKLIDKRKQDLLFNIEHKGTLPQGSKWESPESIKSHIENLNNTLNKITAQKTNLQSKINKYEASNDALALNKMVDESESNVYQNRKGYGDIEIPISNKIQEGEKDATTLASGTDLKTQQSMSKSASGIKPISVEVKPAAQVRANSEGYATQDTPDALAAVQAEKNRIESAARTGKIFSDMSAGLASMRHKTEIKSEGQGYYDALAKTGEGKVKDFEARVEKEKSDPNSEYSVGLRNLLFKQTGRKLPDSMTGEQVAKFAPSIVSIYESDERIKAKHMDIQTANAERALRREELLGVKKEAAAAKGTDNQNKAYSDLRTRITNYRGNAGVQQASKDILSADKALQLVSGKDPNTLTTQDLSLLSGELAKIATGGVSSEHSMISLMPNNLNTKFAELQNFLLSKPSNANAAAYIKKNMHYLTEMKDVAKKSIDSYEQNMIKGFKDRINPDQLKEITQDYSNENPTVVAQKTASMAEVEAYAKAHNISKEASLNVLKAKGYAIK